MKEGDKLELSMKLIKADLLMAQQGIELYKNHEIKEIKNQAAYHLQQAAEKLIKIQIYNSGVSYNNKSLYVHNLKSLIAYIDSLQIDNVIPEIIRKNALIITDWEASGRYDIHFSIRINSLEKYHREISDWYEILYKKGIR